MRKMNGLLIKQLFHNYLKWIKEKNKQSHVPHAPPLLDNPTHNAGCALNIQNNLNSIKA